jgi:Holliday junction DNA helicase RuvA
MITRLAGRLERLDEHAAIVHTPGAPWALEVLLPGYLARDLAQRTGQDVTLHTLFYLEGQGQGSSFIPRLIGFTTPDERAFFELFTTVKGIGNRKALRALAEPPARVAAAIAARDAKALVALPEIGKRLAETVIAELHGKVDAYLLGDLPDPDRPAPRPTMEGKLRPPAVADAIDALCALGETRADAERKVDLALGRLEPSARARYDAPDKILALVYAGR